MSSMVKNKGIKANHLKDLELDHQKVKVIIIK